MAATGGSIQEVSIDGRSFAATADAEVNRKLGGFISTLESNGDGSARKIMVREPWMLDGVVLQNDNSRGDQEFLQAVADDPRNDRPMSITTADGETYNGVGTIVGDLQVSSNSATVTANLSGPGKLNKQI